MDILLTVYWRFARMTIGKLIEIITSKHAALKGERVDATPFRPFDLEPMKHTLSNYGYNRFGNEKFRSGATGEQLSAEIFVGPCFYQALRHHVRDKIAVRGQGPNDPASHQPVGGRTQIGGQRIGGMETDSFISHGASAVLQERLCYSSDAYRTVWCQTCGTIAISNIISKEFICRKCHDHANFGLCTIPYSFRLLLHVLSGVGFSISAGMTRVDQVKMPKVDDFDALADEVTDEAVEEAMATMEEDNIIEVDRYADVGME